jgi:hypothetical protein
MPECLISFWIELLEFCARRWRKHKITNVTDGRISITPIGAGQG